MAGSRYEYVKAFESHEKLLPGCWGVVRLDGRGFTNFAKAHDFVKPNDVNALRLCNAAAAKVLESFDEHLSFAYGQSDEYSFILRRDSTLFSRRESKILSTIVSLFSSTYVALWPKFMPAALHDIPSFDGRVVLYPTTKHLRDYLRWRQADVHVNNLFNTAFWAIVKGDGKTTREAEQLLKGSLSKDKHELLFSQFGINYNDEPEMFRKGSFLTKACHLNTSDSFEYVHGSLTPSRHQSHIVVIHTDIIRDHFWTTNPDILGPSDLDPPQIRKS